jgi:hypothetical protein
MSEYVYQSPRGAKHYIKQKDVDEAFRTLIQAGFDLDYANDKSLDYVIHQINVSEISLTDQLYNNHDQQESDAFCGMVAGRLAKQHFMTNTIKEQPKKD